MKFKSIIFDLDGTLIDSAQSILKSLEIAFGEVGVKPTRTLDSSIVGPPLRQVIKDLIIDEDPLVIERVFNYFVHHYDSVGCLEARVYSRIPEILEKIVQMNLGLYIATNKRLTPADKIIKYFGWDSFVIELFTLDKFSPILKNKKQMLNIILQSNSKIDANSAVYIGDQAEDLVAARYVGLPFIHAGWGYGDLSASSGAVYKLSSPYELVGVLKYGC